MCTLIVCYAVIILTSKITTWNILVITLQTIFHR
jgi:hypothetical protein